jgi:uncharacterized protein (TIGR03437 family)
MRFLIPLAIFASTAHCADFTTYAGSTSASHPIAISAIATDSAGNTYVTGSNAFVTKLDPSGNIVFTTSIGQGYGNCIAVDPAGNVWVGGQAGANFPLVNSLQSSGGPGGTGFLVKMAPDGTVLYSSYFGGVLGNSGVNGAATDQSGNVYVTGFTDASDFPTSAGLPASPVTGTYPPVYGLFTAKLDSTGQKILYSTVIAGINCISTSCGTPNVPRTEGIGIAVDGSGDAIVAGDTNSTDLSVNSGSTPATGAFVFRINAAGDELVYFNYLGSNVSVGSFYSPDAYAATPVAADASGDAYVAGNAHGQGFITKLTPAGATIWTQSLGSLHPAIANAISLDSSDNPWLTGSAFVGELSADGSAFLYAQQFPAGASGQAIAVDASGEVHFAGSIGLISTLTPIEPLGGARALSIVNGASGQLTGTVAPGEIVSIYGLAMGPSSGVTATPEDGQFPNSLGGVQVLVNGTAIPLLYVSAAQINAEIPTSDAGGRLGLAAMADFQVVYNSGTLPDFRLAVVSSNLAAFEDEGSMAVINQDGTLNKIDNPAEPGSSVSIWVTGFGASGAPAVGAAATAANNYCATCQASLNDGSATVAETVEYAGSAPGLIDGVMQINFMLPSQLAYAKGGAWVTFTAAGYSQFLGWVNVK